MAGQGRKALRQIVVVVELREGLRPVLVDEQHGRRVLCVLGLRSCCNWRAELRRIWRARERRRKKDKQSGKPTPPATTVGILRRVLRSTDTRAADARRDSRLCHFTRFAEPTSTRRRLPRYHTKRYTRLDLEHYDLRKACITDLMEMMNDRTLTRPSQHDASAGVSRVEAVSIL